MEAFEVNDFFYASKKFSEAELNFENISNYSYPGARPLFVYVKKIHVEVIPGLKEFVSEFISEKAMGMDGYLFPAGLVPLSDEDFAKLQQNRLKSN